MDGSNNEGILTKRYVNGLFEEILHVVQYCKGKILKRLPKMNLNLHLKIDVIGYRVNQTGDSLKIEQREEKQVHHTTVNG